LLLARWLLAFRSGLARPSRVALLPGPSLITAYPGTTLPPLVALLPGLSLFTVYAGTALPPLVAALALIAGYSRIALCASLAGRACRACRSRLSRGRHIAAANRQQER